MAPLYASPRPLLLSHGTSHQVRHAFLYFPVHPSYSLKGSSLASIHKSSAKPQPFPKIGFKLIDPSIAIEEESIPKYRVQRYYPAHVEEVFNTRYQVVSKLGYGSSSTVWLCCDLMAHQYIALKIYVNSSKVHRELEIYNHLNQMQSNHPGRQCIRKLPDSFYISGPHGRHYCLVHQPLGMSLSDLKMRAHGKVFSEDVMKASVRQLLGVLDFLHNEAHIIHADLQPSNLLMGIDDESVFSEYENAELQYPMLRKAVDDRTIYLARPFPLTFGPPVLCDFGEARFGEEHEGDIMPDVYKAPEVILGMKWSYHVDMWNVAMMDLFEHDRLFQGRNPQKEYDEAYHLAEMIAVLGPPPLDFLKRSENSLRYWDENDDWRGLAPIPSLNLEQLEQRLGGEAKNGYLQFMRKMLCWKPEERLFASEMIFDPWLMEELLGTAGLES